MLTTRLQLIADKLTAKGKLINFKNNSIFKLIDNPRSVNANEIAIKITDILGSDIENYKFKYLPVMNEYIERVNTKVDEFKNSIGDIDVNIVELSIPQYIKELRNRGEFISTGSQTQLPNINFTIPVKEDLTIDDILPENTILNKYASDFVNEKYNINQIKSIWAKYFTDISPRNSHLEDIVFYGTRTKVDELILLFLLVSYVKKNTQDNIRVSLTTYNNALDIIYKNIYKLIAKTIMNYTTYVNNNILVVETDINNKILYVIKDVYGIFLENNSADILFGMLYSDLNKKNNITLSDVETNSDLYINNLNKIINRRKLSEKINMSKYYKNAYLIVLGKMYTEEAFYLNNAYSDRITAVEDEFNKILIGLDTSNILDSAYVARLLFGNLIYGKTSFGLFINYMLEYSKLNDKLTPNQTASFATLGLITDYLINQITISSR